MAQLDRIESVLYEKQLSSGAKLLYCLLETMCSKGEFSISNRELARKLGVTPPTIIRYRRELEDNNLIKVDTERDGNGILSANTYTLLRRLK